MKCPVCSAAVKPTDEFCDNCGAVLSGATAAAVSAKMPSASAISSGSIAASATAAGLKICPNCKTANSAQEEFCMNCGADLNAVPKPVATPVSTVLPATSPTTASNGNGNGSATSSGPLGTSGSPSSVMNAAMGAITCPRCNNLITTKDKFCRKCGLPMAEILNGNRVTTGGTPIEGPGAEHTLKIGVGSKLGEKGRYQITRQVGMGGMGAVFLAEDTVLKRKVVIKALLQSDDLDLVEASIKEREFLAAVKHPNVVQIYDFLQIDTDGYIVMEYVQGETLFSIMEKQSQPFEPAEAIRYMLGILPAFAYMHRLGLVYCDFKPQNIMLEEHKDGTKGVKLIDLGTVIKYEKNPPAVYGTQGFYAPEAVKHPSPETDLYTVARSLAFMVSMMDLDRPQFGMPPAEHYKVFRDNPVLYRFLVKATNPIPVKRFNTVEAMSDQLEGVLRVIAGGQAGVTVSSRLFDSAALNTGKLGTKEMASLDNTDKAYDLLKQGDNAFKSGQSTQALALYNQAAGVNPNSVDAHLRLAELNMERDQYTQALAEITRVQKIDPNNWKIAWYTGRLLEAQGNLPAALDQYRELVHDLPGELPPLLALGRVQAKLGQYRESVETYALVSRAYPDNTESLFGAAFAHVSQQQFKDAAATLKRVNPGSAKFSDAQQSICDLYLYQKPQAEPDDLAEVSGALRNLQDQGNETPQFLLARADFYRKAWELSDQNKMPAIALPHEPMDATVTVAPPKRQLGRLAEESYEQYLKRLPANDPNREQVVREKFKVAPWRII